MFPSIVLLIWLFVGIGLFAQLPTAKAIAYVALIGILFMPEIAKLPIPLPVFKVMGKSEVTCAAGILGCYFFARKRFRPVRIGHGIDLVVWLSIVFSLITVSLNLDLLVFGPTLVPALSINEIILYPIYQVLGLACPFWLGRLAIASVAEAKQFIRIFIGMALVYSLLELFEMRMSPNLHLWIYGVSPFENFTMAYRWGGYRPTVFTAGGLAVAIFALGAAMLSAVHLVIQKRSFGVSTRLVFGYLTVMLVLGRGTGAILFGAVFLLSFLLLKPKRCFLIISLLSVLFCAYPVVRILDSFPDDILDEYYATASPDVQDRLSSMQFRFRNEKILTERARERFWFGWGGSSRNRVYNSEGEDISITDGAWIITFGVSGVLGFAMTYGLQLIPLIYAGKRARRLRRKENIAIFCGFCFVQLGYLLDQIPNGVFSFAPYFFAGVVWQFGKVAIDDEKRGEATQNEAPPPPPDRVHSIASRKVIIVR